MTQASPPLTTRFPDVRKEVEVSLPRTDAFNLFIADPLGWWPPKHCFVANRVNLVIEPYAGGRYYEVDVDGTEVDWGRILTFTRPGLLEMTWRVGAGWQPLPDDNGASLIRVEFTELSAGRTRVALTHADLDLHGPAAAQIHAAVDGPSPGETLARFAGLVDLLVVPGQR